MSALEPPTLSEMGKLMNNIVGNVRALGAVPLSCTLRFLRIPSDPTDWHVHGAASRRL